MMNNTPFIFQSVKWADAQQVLRQIRTEVFIQEQGVPVAEEWDGLDENAAHFLVRTLQGDAIACARVLTESEPRRYRIGRVAVLKAFRRQGIGRLLMRSIMDECSSLPGIIALFLHAQIESRHFYEQLGFVAEGEEFMDAGIAHIAMHYEADHPSPKT